MNSTSMYKLRLVSSVSVLGCLIVGGCFGQAKLSEPVVDAKVKAGSSLGIPVSLGKTSPQNLTVRVQYINSEVEKQRTSFLNQSQNQGQGRFPPAFMPDGSFFSCSGNISPNQHEAVLSCTTARTNLPGEYKVQDKSFSISRSETGEQQTPQGVRFPIITIVAADPYDQTIFPEVLAASLSLDLRGSFFDASSRAQDILTDLGNHFSTTITNSVPNRLYLQQQIRLARSIIDLTSRRVAGNTSGQQPSNTAALPMFEDFDRRLDRILRKLAPQHASSNEAGQPILVLASAIEPQRPQASESITVTSRGNRDSDTQEVLSQFVEVLTDMSRGFLTISQDGKTDFTWSITTTPPGAEIWYSRLNEEEIKWGGVSNQKDQVLPKLRWIFRISWAGCSKVIDTDPWLQDPVSLQEVKAGCQDHVNH